MCVSRYIPPSGLGSQPLGRYITPDIINVQFGGERTRNVFHFLPTCSVLSVHSSQISMTYDKRREEEEEERRGDIFYTSSLIHDGWIPLSGLSFRVLVICSLLHCHIRGSLTTESRSMPIVTPVLPDAFTSTGTCVWHMEVRAGACMVEHFNIRSAHSLVGMFEVVSLSLNGTPPPPFEVLVFGGPGVVIVRPPRPPDRLWGLGFDRSIDNHEMSGGMKHPLCVRLYLDQNESADLSSCHLQDHRGKPLGHDLLGNGMRKQFLSYLGDRLCLSGRMKGGGGEEAEGWVARTWTEENRKDGSPMATWTSCQIQREQAAAPDLSLPPRLPLAREQPQHRFMGTMELGVKLRHTSELGEKLSDGVKEREERLRRWRDPLSSTSSTS
ncbi:unnamed protein product [Pleuronectes platessa]|uniref:Uncharacterized protein n=1 Tax=Pleuronectes platessa TaxID=8262 RepID=A0A9N7UEE0_PLEPL|nr:unnamed protein product [Pleuronectes platessa]